MASWAAGMRSAGMDEQIQESFNCIIGLQVERRVLYFNCDLGKAIKLTGCLTVCYISSVIIRDTSYLIATSPQPRSLVHGGKQCQANEAFGQGNAPRDDLSPWYKVRKQTSTRTS